MIAISRKEKKPTHSLSLFDIITRYRGWDYRIWYQVVSVTSLVEFCMKPKSLVFKTEGDMGFGITSIENLRPCCHPLNANLLFLFWFVLLCSAIFFSVCLPWLLHNRPVILILILVTHSGLRIISFCCNLNLDLTAHCHFTSEHQWGYATLSWVGSTVSSLRGKLSTILAFIQVLVFSNVLQSEEVLEFSTALSLFGNVYFPRFEKNGNFWSMKKTMKMNEEGGKLREEVYEKNFFQDLGNFFFNYDYTCET